MNHPDEETENIIKKYNPLNNLKKYPPTTLILTGGSQDPVIPKEGIIQLHKELEPLYALNPENLKLKIYDVGHEYSREMEAEVNQWLTKHL